MITKRLTVLFLASSLAACVTGTPARMAQQEGADLYSRELYVQPDFEVRVPDDLGVDGEQPAASPVSQPTFLSATIADVELMARTLWGEARQQPDVEVEMIANVIVNRVMRGIGGNTIKDVIMSKLQFSVWNRCEYRSVSYRVPVRVRLRGRWTHVSERRRRTVCGWNKNRAMTIAASDDDPNMIRAKDIAVKVIEGRRDGTLVDVSNGADHYHAKYVRPKWAKRSARVAVAQAHYFYAFYGS